LCEEFHCLPSQAWREWQRAPVGWLETILDYRAYAAAKWANEIDPKGDLTTEMRQLARGIEFDLAQEEINGA